MASLTIEEALSGIAALAHQYAYYRHKLYMAGGRDHSGGAVCDCGNVRPSGV